MASNFVPMLSSSPPPLDDCPDDDDDDFGNFTSAKIPFDSSFDSPVATSKPKSFKAGDNGVNDLNLSNDFNNICSYGDTEISNRRKDASHKSEISAHVNKQSNCDENELPFLNSPNDVNISKNDKTCDSKLILNSVPCDASSVLSSVDSLDGELVRSSEPIELKLSSCEDNITDNNFDRSDESSDSEFTPPGEASIHNNFSLHAEYSSLQSKPCGLFNSSLYSDCDAKPDEAQHSDISFECFKEGSCVSENLELPVEGNSCISENLDCPVGENDFVSKHLDFPVEGDSGISENLEFPVEGNCCISENLEFPVRGNNFFSKHLEFSVEGNDFVSENLEFPVDFAATEDDFDDFQQAIPNLAQTTEINSDIISAKSLSQSKTDDEFRTDFNSACDSVNGDSVNDDDFEDFQSFNKAPSACTGNSVSETDLKVLEDDDFQDFKKCEQIEDELDEFDDFQGCSASDNSSVQEFANFESVPFEEKLKSDSPQFADFESASFSSDETRSNFACASSSTQDKNIDKIATVLSAIFPPASESSDDYCDQPAEVLEQSNKSHRLWEKLHEVEQAPSLRFQWGVSHSFQQLLRSINVDYHSILRTSSVPIFASSLSLLEPVKGQTKTANAESDVRKKVQNVPDAIPPVEFDWTSSGLVNPLDSEKAASVLMDLSFLATSDTATSPSNNTHSFENELLKPSPSHSESSNKTLILEELLSKSVCSLPNSKTSHRPPNISEEANSVLDQLPDLSFMRAKVLMFPISSKT